MANTNTNQNTEEKNFVIIDPAELMKAPVGTKAKIDADEDAWAETSLPPHDIYVVRPHLSKNGLKWNKPDEKKGTTEGHFTVSIEHRIIKESDPDVHNYPAFQYLSTRMGRGKKISTVAGFIKKLGFKLPEEASDRELVAMLLETLKKDKTLFAEIDWRASYKEVDGNYKNLCSTMTDFPKDEEGEFMSTLRVTNSKGTVEEVRAQLNVTKLWSKKEYAEDSKEGNLPKISNTVSSKVVQTAQLAEEEDSTPVVAANGAIKKGEAEKSTKVKKAEPVVEDVSEENFKLALQDDE